MSDEQETGSEEEPVAKKLVTVDRLTRDRQRREEKSKGALERPTDVTAKVFLFQLYIGYRIFGFATLLCLILGIASIFIDYTDIPLLADFGFKPFIACLIAYVWLKVARTQIGLALDTNGTFKDIQNGVHELRSRD
ncbi:MAG: hypothetical protein OSA98_02525 [Rubripirellula sp.]|nr:hypothetical protein [Rubripirellula sp.]